MSIRRLKQSLCQTLLLVAAVAPYPSHAFVSNKNESGQSRRWILSTSTGQGDAGVPAIGREEIPYFISAAGFSRTNTAAEINAIRASFDQWQSVPNTSLRFKEIGLLSGMVDVNPNDNTNLVFWATDRILVNGGRDSLLGTLGLTVWRTSSDNTMRESDIALNGVQFSWFTDFSQTNSPYQFIESAFMHEIGHFIGLDHSPAGGATMFGRGATGIGTQAGLSADEIAAAQWLYPSPESNRETGTIQGRVIGDSAGVRGAIIVAETAAGNLAAATVSSANGTYELPKISAGIYNVRVTPLDPVSNRSLDRLLSGGNISREFINAETSFRATTNITVKVERARTSTIDITVNSEISGIRITRIRPPSSIGAPLVAVNSPVTILPGSSNILMGVYSPAQLSPASTFSVTGDGILLSSFQMISDAFPGTVPSLNLVSAMVDVSRDAAPGLRTLVLRDGNALAYANGFLEILPSKVDFNFDGLDDRFQREYFPLFTEEEAHPDRDPDHDNLNNREENLTGTDPTDSMSLLRIEKVLQTMSGTKVSWLSKPGKKYQLLGRSQFDSRQWQPIGNPIESTGKSTEMTDSLATDSTRFYRVMLVP